jgi:hypothetical protein
MKTILLIAAFAIAITASTPNCIIAQNQPNKENKKPNDKGNLNQKGKENQNNKDKGQNKEKVDKTDNKQDKATINSNKNKDKDKDKSKPDSVSDAKNKGNAYGKNKGVGNKCRKTDDQTDTILTKLK